MCARAQFVSLLAGELLCAFAHVAVDRIDDRVVRSAPLGIGILQPKLLGSRVVSTVPVTGGCCGVQRIFDDELRGPSRALYCRCESRVALDAVSHRRHVDVCSSRSSLQRRAHAECGQVLSHLAHRVLSQIRHRSLARAGPAARWRHLREKESQRARHIRRRGSAVGRDLTKEFCEAQSVVKAQCQQPLAAAAPGCDHRHFTCCRILGSLRNRLVYLEHLDSFAFPVQTGDLWNHNVLAFEAGVLHTAACVTRIQDRPQCLRKLPLPALPLVPAHLPHRPPAPVRG